MILEPSPDHHLGFTDSEHEQRLKEFFAAILGSVAGDIPLREIADHMACCKGFEKVDRLYMEHLASTGSAESIRELLPAGCTLTKAKRTRRWWFVSNPKVKNPGVIYPAWNARGGGNPTYSPSVLL